MLATRITWVTTVGIAPVEYPRSNCRCCSVLCDDSKEYRIVNFVAENLEEVVRRGVVWPIAVKAISERHAVIHDARIPDNWYSLWFCEVCCPVALLPVPQLLAHVRIDTSKAPKL